MKRYFDVVDKKQSLELTIVDGSPASKATPEELGKALKLNLREVSQPEYEKITKSHEEEL